MQRLRHRYDGRLSPEAVRKDDRCQSMGNLLSLRGPRQAEAFAYVITSAIGLLASVRVMTFHTASVETRHSRQIFLLALSDCSAKPARVIRVVGKVSLAQ
jgi:hypothetical protein